MSIRSHGFETSQSQLPFEFTSVLANPSSQSEALKCCSERIAAMSVHQTLQDLNDNDKSIISLKSDEEIPQHKCEESVIATHTLNREELLNHLAHIYRNYCNIGSVKTNDSIYLWFHLANRPARAEDALDIYKFKHQSIIPLIANMRMFNFN
ncbi:uncharacterized protein CIMG_13302 [Coccidioides immitis RS]|uniref:Uncharacterized protein n=1 Tax=Coccidioides immitis (strain RS) TaxID=246410 RepID=A0A0E1RV40_COCIM|nr:uncharacterized protein CIMG_13302 [Coccidioides immitis RS]EAS29043.2 hypothetical protein CIMG_13302 [Coccidioides immitis RS]